MIINKNFMGEGVQNKRPSMGGGGYGYFLELHIVEMNHGVFSLT